MLKFLCLAVFVVGAFASQLEDEIFHRTISTYDGRIVGGDEARVGQFPHQVSLRVRNGQRHFCGGSIISDRFILSAAHCTQNQTSNPANVRAVVGAHRVSTGGTQYALDRIVNHPAYSMQTVANDISVLRTTQRIVFSPLIQAIALPTADVPAAGGVPAFLSGWGQFRNGDPQQPANHPDILQWKNTETITRANCIRRLLLLGRNVHANTLCTTNPRNIGACRGDSGGPLTTRTTPRVLIGVVSWGIPCGRGFPDVYARVFPHLTFIRSAMQL